MTHTDINMLYKAILAAPDDILARLAYADALEEMGEDLGHASLIRLQVEREQLVRKNPGIKEAIRQGYAYFPPESDGYRIRVIDCICDDFTLMKIKSEVVQKFILPAIGHQLYPFVMQDNDDIPTMPLSVKFHSGFPDEIYCMARNWIRTVHRAVATSPVRKVHFVDFEPQQGYRVEHDLENRCYKLTVRNGILIYGSVMISEKDFRSSISPEYVCFSYFRNLIHKIWPKIEFYIHTR